jgi:hypothetical protein
MELRVCVVNKKGAKPAASPRDTHQPRIVIEAAGRDTPGVHQGRLILTEFEASE